MNSPGNEEDPIPLHNKSRQKSNMESYRSKQSIVDDTTISGTLKHKWRFYRATRFLELGLLITRTTDSKEEFSNTSNTTREKKTCIYEYV